MSVASKQIRPCFKLCLWQQNQLEQTRHRDGFLAALVAKMFLMRRRDIFEPHKWQQI